MDAAHATDLVTRRSITGLIFMFGGGPWAYKSKIQSIVSTRSTEAEFFAAVHAAKIAKYLRSIFLELGPTTLFEDNAALILMVNASRPTPCARHIDIQHFALQEWKANQEIVLSHIHDIVNSADSHKVAPLHPSPSPRPPLYGSLWQSLDTSSFRIFSVGCTSVAHCDLRSQWGSMSVHISTSLSPCYCLLHTVVYLPLLYDYRRDAPASPICLI